MILSPGTNLASMGQHKLVWPASLPLQADTRSQRSPGLSAGAACAGCQLGQHKLSGSACQLVQLSTSKRWPLMHLQAGCQLLFTP